MATPCNERIPCLSTYYINCLHVKVTLHASKYILEIMKTSNLKKVLTNFPRMSAAFESVFRSSSSSRLQTGKRSRNSHLPRSSVFLFVISCCRRKIVMRLFNQISSNSMIILLLTAVTYQQK